MARKPFHTLSLGGSFREALAWTGGLMLASLAVMAIAMAAGLAQANRLLEELSSSQDQLAQVTRFEADINSLLADGALKTRTDRELAGEAADIETRLRDYRQSIRDEGRLVGDSKAAVSHQTKEAHTADVLSEAFLRLDRDLAADLPASNPAAKAQIETDRRGFTDLARQVVTGERQEIRDSIGAMSLLRGRLTWLGVAILLGVGLFGVVGAWIMLASMIRPLRALEAAAERAGRGESPSPVNVHGFTEFQEFARAFNRMDREIAAQRAALSDANLGLEAQVVERTREIEASREKLAEIDRTRRLFFSQISHELRTPVTVIRGEAEVALRDAAAPAPRLRDALEHVVANGGFLQRRLEDMLALARAEDGRVALQRNPVGLADVVRAALALAEPYARSSGMALIADLPDGRGPLILGDASWLQQALLALVDNAAKFAAGSEAIRFTLQADNDQACIVVADCGPGVAAEDLPFLFESYSQAPAGRGRGGSGLGLSIARWVVEQHGGSIAAHSAPEQGLVIEIALPVSA